MRKTILALLLIAVSLAACTRESVHPEPLQALKSPRPLIESNFGPDFWHDQHERRTHLWREASDYCNEPHNRHTENCEVLLSLTDQPRVGAHTPVPYPKSWSAPDAPHAGLPVFSPNGWPSPTP